MILRESPSSPVCGPTSDDTRAPAPEAGAAPCEPAPASVHRPMRRSSRASTPITTTPAVPAGPWITAAQAAERLHVTVDQVQRLALAGRLKKYVVSLDGCAHLSGRNGSARVLFRLADVDAVPVLAQ